MTTDGPIDPLDPINLFHDKPSSVNEKSFPPLSTAINPRVYSRNAGKFNRQPI